MVSFILTTTFNGVWTLSVIIIINQVTFVKIYEFFWSDLTRIPSSNPSRVPTSSESRHQIHEGSKHHSNPVIKSMKGPDSTQIPSSKNPHLKTEMRIFIIYRIESNIKIHLTGR